MDIYNLNAQSEINDSVKLKRAIAQQLADETDFTDYGIRGIYLFGSVARGEARKESDIDLLFHVNNTDTQQIMLLQWLKGWDRALCTTALLSSGKMPPYVLDIHIATEEDIQNNDSFAYKMKSLFDPAEPLKIL